MKIADASEIPYREYVHPREGTVELKILVAASAGQDLNFNCALTRYGRGQERFATPRHRHTFEQIRFPLEGALNYGPGREIPEGWVGYFPEGAYYGPQEVDGGTVLLLQFGIGYLSEEQKRTIHAVLSERGEFHDGVYTFVDPATGRTAHKDGVQAMWEEAHGRPLEYPKPRYPEPILMNPAAFSWTRRPTGPRVARKQLGVFTERETSIEFVRMEEGAVLTLGADRAQLLFSTEGTLEVAGAVHSVQTTIFSEGGESVLATARETARALLICFPSTQ